MSTIFLQSPSNAIGYMGDNVFQVAMTTYLVQPHTPSSHHWLADTSERKTPMSTSTEQI